MTDMIEKVANEIRYACAASYAVENMLCPWGDAPENDKQGWRGIARAAIRALMEPTDKMKNDGWVQCTGTSMDDVTTTYQAMLKAALDD